MHLVAASHSCTCAQHILGTVSHSMVCSLQCDTQWNASGTVPCYMYYKVLIFRLSTTPMPGMLFTMTDLVQVELSSGRTKYQEQRIHVHVAQYSIHYSDVRNCKYSMMQANHIRHIASKQWYYIITDLPHNSL